MRITEVQFFDRAPVALHEQLDALVSYFVFGYNLIFDLHRSRTLILGHSKFVISRMLVSDRCCYATILIRKSTEKEGVSGVVVAPVVPVLLLDVFVLHSFKLK